MLLVSFPMEVTPEQQRWLCKSVAELGLSDKALGLTEHLGVVTILDLLKQPSSALYVKRYGEKTREEIYRALARVGFYRKGLEPIKEKAPDFQMAIADLGVEERIANLLEKKGVLTVADFLSRSKTELLSIRHFGEKSFQRVCDALVRRRFLLKPSEASANGSSSANGTEVGKKK